MAEADPTPASAETSAAIVEDTAIASVEVKVDVESAPTPVINKIVEAADNMEIAAVGPKVEELRRTYRTNVTIPHSWRVRQLRQFRKMLEEHIDEWHAALLADLNKSEWESYTTETVLILGEIQHMLDNLGRLTGSHSTWTNILNFPGWSSVHKDPLGVVLIMGAWNFPVHLTLLPLVGAIAAGNCAVIKPPSFSVQTSNLIAKLLPQYLDPRCFVVVEGGVPISTEVLKQRFDLIFYTGSGNVAKIVMAAAAKHLTPTVLELGGKSPVIVDRSADVELAARRIAWGSFLNAGQICVRPDYVLVHPTKVKRLIELLRERLNHMFGSNAAESGEFCRIVNVQNAQRLQTLIEDSKHLCTVAVGGESKCSERFIPPTILDFGSNEANFISSKVMAGEIFGPILPIFSPPDDSTFLDYCINFINNRDKPLALYVFTTNSTTRRRFTQETSSGALVFNDVLLHVSNESLPFGGVGPSGMGAYHGDRSFEVFSHTKAVMRKTSFLDLSFRYPPYTNFGKFQAGLLMKPRPAWQIKLLVWLTVLLLAGAIVVAVLGGNPSARAAVNWH